MAGRPWWPWGLGLAGVGLVGVLAVAGWALATHEQALAHPHDPLPALSASTDPQVVERGRYLVHGPAHCNQCHSSPDRARPELVTHAPLTGGLAFAMGPLGTFYGRNLTPDEETGIGRLSDGELARTLRSGVLPDGRLSIFMRYSASALSDEDIVAVISYLRSLEPVRNPVPPGELSLLGKLAVRPLFGGATPRPARPERATRGQYLADDVMLCTACHTELDPATFEPAGPTGGGGSVERSHGDDTHMEFAAPNLTSHPTGITGKLDEDAFVARMRRGRTIASSIMPWESIQGTTDADLRATYRYLRSLPPVDRDTGPTYRPVGWTPGS